MWKKITSLFSRRTKTDKNGQNKTAKKGGFFSRLFNRNKAVKNNIEKANKRAVKYNELLQKRYSKKLEKLLGREVKESRGGARKAHNVLSRESLEKRLGGDDFKFSSWREYEDFIRFLEDVKTRIGGAYMSTTETSPGTVSDVFEVWNESKRLDLNNKMIASNFEYWRDHKKDLKKIDDIRDMQVSNSDALGYIADMSTDQWLRNLKK